VRCGLLASSGAIWSQLALLQESVARTGNYNPPEQGWFASQGAPSWPAAVQSVHVQDNSNWVGPVARAGMEERIHTTMRGLGPANEGVGPLDHAILKARTLLSALRVAEEQYLRAGPRGNS
jgi:hypothetical protein